VDAKEELLAVAADATSLHSHHAAMNLRSLQ